MEPSTEKEFSLLQLRREGHCVTVHTLALALAFIVVDNPQIVNSLALRVIGLFSSGPIPFGLVTHLFAESLLLPSTGEGG